MLINKNCIHKIMLTIISQFEEQRSNAVSQLIDLDKNLMCILIKMLEIVHD